MTPIETVVAAIDQYADSLPETSDFRIFLRSHKHGVANAMVMALAYCELPRELIIRVEAEYDRHESLDTAFHELHRAIAAPESEKENDAIWNEAVEACARAIEETEKELVAEGEVYILVKAASHMRSLKRTAPESEKENGDG